MSSLKKKSIAIWLWGGAFGLLLVWIGAYSFHSTAHTRKQCEQWIPYLEAYRKAKGHYPSHLFKLTAHDPAAEALMYREYGCGYGTTRGEWFELETPGPGVKAAVYRSETGEWQSVAD